MRHYQINQGLHAASWWLLAIGVLAAVAIPVLLLRGSPLWYLPLPGVVYLSIWSAYAATYPKAVVIDAGRIVFVMPAGRDGTAGDDELKVRSLRSVYAIECTKEGVTRRLRVSKQGLPDELRDRIAALAS